MKIFLAIFLCAVVFLVLGLAVGEYLKPVGAPPTPVVEAVKTIVRTGRVSVPKASMQDNNNMANPASVYCGEQGGTTVIKTLPSGGEYGLCEFEGDQACEEWAMYRGDCPVGGIKTIGFDNIEQSYCVWVGGRTLAVANAQCTLPDGTVCSDRDLYYGTCSQE